jgi:hypothetical protein
VDEDYRGNLCVVLFNHSDQPFNVSHGDRIAQLICQQIYYPELQEVEVSIVQCLYIYLELPCRLFFTLSHRIVVSVHVMTRISFTFFLTLLLSDMFLGLPSVIYIVQ